MDTDYSLQISIVSDFLTDEYGIPHLVTGVRVDTSIYVYATLFEISEHVDALQDLIAALCKQDMSKIDFTHPGFINNPPPIDPSSGSWIRARWVPLARFRFDKTNIIDDLIISIDSCSSDVSSVEEDYLDIFIDFPPPVSYSIRTVDLNDGGWEEFYAPNNEEVLYYINEDSDLEIAYAKIYAHPKFQNPITLSLNTELKIIKAYSNSVDSESKPCIIKAVASKDYFDTGSIYYNYPGAPVVGVEIEGSN